MSILTGDTLCHVQGIDRAKRVLLLEIGSNLRVPEFEREFAMRTIERTCGELVKAITEQAQQQELAWRKQA